MALTSAELRRAHRVLDTVALPRLLAAIKGEPLSPRDRPELIADLHHLLQADPAYIDLGRAFLEGEPSGPSSSRFAAVWVEVVERLPTRGHHHLALLHLRWGWEALNHEPDPRTRRQSAIRRWATALRHAGRVAADAGFFDALAAASAAAGQGEALRRRVPELLLGPHGRALIEGLAVDATLEPSRLEPHWKLLVEAPDLVRELLPDADSSHDFEACSARWRARVIEEVVADCERLAAEVDPVEATVDDLRRPIYHARRFTNLAGMQEPLTLWVIETTVRWAWPLYKGEGHGRLEALVAATRPFGTHLESLLLRGVGAFGRQAMCADYLLFVADFASGEEEDRLQQRALKVCPNHRNARLMLSYRRLHDAHLQLIRLETSEPLERYVPGLSRGLEEAVERAAAAIALAEELFPANERLPDYVARLARARARLGLD